MKILVVGSGGREHALCWKLKQSPQLTALYAAPGNAGIAALATLVPLGVEDVDALARWAKEQAIDLVVIGPEAPLVLGLADKLAALGIPAFGPSAKAAQLEGSKAFAKAFMDRHHIPTAAYAEFDNASAARAYVEQQGAPIVIKADGLAAGKGVTVAMTLDEALEAIDESFSGKFGAAGERLVIEEYLEGEELSFFALVSDGEALELGSAQDHKRVGEGDTGPNTGGMGTYSPAPVATAAMHQTVMEQVVKPLARGMVAEGMPYRGVLFVGLMATNEGPKVIEFNVRFGDPETQSLMLRLESDLPQLMLATATGGLASQTVALRPESALCVVMAAEGYPDAYQKNTVIRGLDAASAVPGVVVFHAGTAEKEGEILAIGGRVLGITASAPSLQEARDRAYQAVDKLEWEQGFCRRDIGWRALDGVVEGRLAARS
jgi:phosphoribosylamine--glycine ligase